MHNEKFILQALEEAEKAYKRGEVPVGAVLVKNGEILARGHNLVESFQDSTCHAEMVAIRSAQKKISNWRLTDCTLYVTLEPCSMCAGAAILARVKKIVYGAPDLRHGAPRSLYSDHPIHKVEIEGGVLEKECGLLLKNFFKERRNAQLSHRDDRTPEKAPSSVRDRNCPTCHK